MLETIYKVSIYSMLVSYLHLLRFSFCYLVLLCNIVVLSSVISCNFLHQTDIQIPKKKRIRNY